MTESLKDFITRRRDELYAAEADLHVQLDALKEELDQLRKAALAAGIDLDAPAEEKEPKTLKIGDLKVTIGGPPPAIRSPRRLPEKTIKDAVLDILVVGPRGMTALEILAEINRRYKADYPRTSLSPQLSRLKGQGLIRRKGNIWRRVKLATEKPEPAGPTLFGNGPAGSDVNQH